MHNKFICLVVFGFFLTSFSLLGGEPNKTLELKCLRPTVMVMHDSGYGSGVIIRSVKTAPNRYTNVLLTCRHVIDDEDTDNFYIATLAYEDWSKVDLSKSKVYPSTVYAQHPSHDMAIMLFESEQKMPVAELGFDEELYISNEILGIGCAFAEYPRIDFGYISGVFPDLLRTHLLAMPGDSGGPIFHNNKVVALKTLFMLPSVNGSRAPSFHASKHVRITVLKKWAVFDPTVKIYDEKDELPQLPLMFLRFKAFTH